MPSRPVDRLHRDVEIGGRSALALHPHFLLEQLAGRRLLDGPLHHRRRAAGTASGSARPRSSCRSPRADLRRPPRRFLAVQLDDGAVGLHQDEDFEDGVEHGAETGFARARARASARSTCAFNSSSASLARVMSVATPMKPTSSPSGPKRGCETLRSQRYSPSKRG